MRKHFSSTRFYPAILVFLATVSLPPAALAQDCRLISFGDVPLTRSADGKLQLAAMVDGKPAEVGIDFDREANLISRAEAEKRGGRLKVGAQLVTPGEDSRNDVAAFGSLRLAGADLPSFEAFVDEGRNSIDGIVLGRNVFANFLTEIDIAHNVIRLFARSQCANSVVYWSAEYLKLTYEEDRGRFLISAKINDKDAHIALAPGLAHSVVDAEAVDTMSLQRQDDSGAILSTLEFGGVKLRNLPVESRNLKPDLRFMRGGVSYLSARRTMKAVDLKIGADVLKHLRFMIDFQEKTIYFTVG